MSSAPDLYETLGVDRGASSSDIKKAYRQLAKEFHPDVNQSSGAEVRFKEVSAAYEVVSDPEKRQQYDRFGHAGVGNSGAQGFDGAGFGGFGDIFDSFFRSTGARRSGPQQGADLRTVIEIDLEDVLDGVEHELKFSRVIRCQPCKGNGEADGASRPSCGDCSGTGEISQVQKSLFGQFVNVTVCGACRGEGPRVVSPCTDCDGTGLIESDVERIVSIPAGIDTGETLRIRGEGDQGPRGAEPGNLYAEIKVREHSKFMRYGRDLVTECELNMVEASLGAKLDGITLSGESIALDLDPGVQSGARQVLKGHGVPDLRGRAKGDLYLQVRVVTPTSLTARQQDLIRELGESLTDAHRPDDAGSMFDRIRSVFGS